MAGRFERTGTVAFDGAGPVLLSSASVVGPNEGNGPLGGYFDLVLPDELWGESSWERTERRMLREGARLAVEKAGLRNEDMAFFVAGDLLDQIVSANFTAHALSVPFLGVYAACATSAESLGLAALLAERTGGYALCATASHHNTAERQYRFPVELGVQRRPTAQWTATAAAAFVVGAVGEGVRITHFTIGRVMDLGRKDPNDMGSAMAPAAADTIHRHLRATGRSAADYDLILTGDLGKVGQPITRELLAKEGVDLEKTRFEDSGLLLYDENKLDVHAGGSGAGASAAVLSSLLHRMRAKEFRRLLLVATGALLSPTTVQQGDSIPAVAHAVALEVGDEA